MPRAASLCFTETIEIFAGDVSQLSEKGILFLCLLEEYLFQSFSAGTMGFNQSALTVDCHAERMELDSVLGSEMKMK